MLGVKGIKQVEQYCKVVVLLQTDQKWDTKKQLRKHHVFETLWIGTRQHALSISESVLR